MVKLRVSDVAPGGSLRQRATVIQQKTRRPAPLEITDTTRDAFNAWLALRGCRDYNSLFPDTQSTREHIGTRQDDRLVDRWVSMIEVEPHA